MTAGPPGYQSIFHRETLETLLISPARAERRCPSKVRISLQPPPAVYGIVLRHCGAPEYATLLNIISYQS
jgi:hypothetical protein